MSKSNTLSCSQLTERENFYNQEEAVSPSGGAAALEALRESAARNRGSYRDAIQQKNYLTSMARPIIVD